MKNKRLLLVFAILELILFVLTVCYDFFMPTVVISVIGFLFLLLRKEKLS